MFSLSLSILAFDFIYFKGSFFLAFWGKEIGYFEGWGQIQIVLGSTHIVHQPSFIFFVSFDSGILFCLNFGVIFVFMGP